MNQQSERLPPQTKSSKSSSSSRFSDLRRYVSRRYYCLGILAGTVFSLMMVGIIFAAHQYYVDFGGQGWLRIREEIQTADLDQTPRLYLPLRQVEVREKSQYLSPFKRFPGKNLPFYTCGDQQNSCETFDQPNICCPVGMGCYATDHSPSGIFCCNAISSSWQCQASGDHIPICMESTVECGIEMGGGCCPSFLECSPNGCIHVTNQSRSGNSISSPSTTNTESTTPTSINPASITANITDGVTLTKTVTQFPPATQTLPKGGEIAQVGAGTHSIKILMYLSYPVVWVLLCLTVLMSFL